jgi:hypothetical protein
MARFRNIIETRSPIAAAVLRRVNASGLRDQFIIERAKVGINFLGRLRKGGSYDIASIERVARVIGLELVLAPIAEPTTHDERIAIEIEEDDKIAIYPEMTAEQRADWINLRLKGYPRPRIATMLGLTLGAAA